jgi:HSP20 family protein
MTEKAERPRQSAAGLENHTDPCLTGNELPDEVARCWGRAWPALPWAFRKHLAAGEEACAWVPSMDVYETEGELVVKVDLPGVKRSAIAIEVCGSNLVVRGERLPEHEMGERCYYRLERPYGVFQRHLPLPFAMTSDQIVARCSDGLLEIRLPLPGRERSAAREVHTLADAERALGECQATESDDGDDSGDVASDL